MKWRHGSTTHLLLANQNREHVWQRQYENIQTPYIYIQPLEGAFVCPRSYHDGVSKRDPTMGFLTTFYKYIIAIFYCHRPSLCLLAVYKTNKISNAGSCTPTEWWKREATMGFLTTFYKYIIQQYFTVTAPHSVFSQYIKQIKYQMW